MCRLCSDRTRGDHPDSENISRVCNNLSGNRLSVELFIEFSVENNFLSEEKAQELLEEFSSYQQVLFHKSLVRCKEAILGTRIVHRFIGLLLNGTLKIEYEKTGAEKSFGTYIGHYAPRKKLYCLYRDVVLVELAKHSKSDELIIDMNDFCLELENEGLLVNADIDSKFQFCSYKFLH